MIVLGHLREGQRDRCHATDLAADVAFPALMRRNAPAQVGQREVGLSIAAIGRAEQREQGLVLIDGQQLTVAHRPPLGWKVERHHPDFRQKRLRHALSSGKTAS